LALVDKSLLQPAGGGLRYRMLETIREYGVERLAERAELDDARLRHARYFAALTADLDPVLRTRDQLAALEVIRVERDNILGALRYLGDCGRRDRGGGSVFVAHLVLVDDRCGRRVPDLAGIRALGRRR
ncbi:MAG TPA: hypothetical protein VFC16_13850, partial [Nakamurella sp.]|nr:hypothetical protein [Nakamurella sp.]